MNEITALFLSFGLVFALIGIASFLLAFGYVSGEVSRKIIHIGVSNWWLIAMNFMKTPLIAIIGPVSFIIINIISYKKHLFPAMEDDVPRDNLGTIYFPISLLILVLLCFNGLFPMYAGAAGILVLGYGDGLAALTGKHFGRFNLSFGPFHTKKTLLGSLTMFMVTAVVLSLVVEFAVPDTSLFGSLFEGLFGEGAGEGTLITAARYLPTAGIWGRMAAISFAVTLVELFTPRGFDNLSVPLFTAALFAVVPF